MKDRTPPSLKGGNHATVVQVCVTCGDDYRAAAKVAERYTTCSRECNLERRRNRGLGNVEATCAECGMTSIVKAFEVAAGLRRYCSNQCRMAGLQRTDRKRGSEKRYVGPTEYVRVIDWSTGRKRFIMEHRLVMEKLIGRPLTRAERVHHINGIPGDNRPENLRLYATQAEHIRVEHPELAPRALRARWARRTADKVA